MKATNPFSLTLFFMGLMIFLSSHTNAQQLYTSAKNHSFLSPGVLSGNEQYFKYEIADLKGCDHKMAMRASKLNGLTPGPPEIQPQYQKWSIPLFMSKSPESIQYSFLEETFTQRFPVSGNAMLTIYSQ